MAPKRKANDDDLDFGRSNILTTAEQPARSRRSTRAKKSDNVQAQQASPKPVFEKEGQEESSNEEDAENIAESLPAKSKKGKDKKIAVSEEKRQARFKKSCPKVIQERVDRVKHQRFYMIGRERLNEALQETFKVLGSTGNVYTVTISRIPKCDCPDGTKGNHCKHIIFVFLKILDVPDSSSYYYQKALLTSELEEIFAGAPPDPTLVASQRVIKALAHATGAAAESSEQGATHGENRRDVDGADCPICYEEMKGKTEAELTSIVFCDVCLNGIHADCFKMWAIKTPVTCVYCRAPVVANTTGPGGTVMNGAYLNLAREAGVSRVRDTSTYYHGVIKGRKHWERHQYDD